MTAKKAPERARTAPQTEAATTIGRPHRKGADGLTDQHRAFVREYLVDRNATAAALRCGYAKSGAKQQGSRLLAIPAVRAAVDAHQDQLDAEARRVVGIDLERTLREVAGIAFFDPADLFTPEGEPLPLTAIPAAARAAVAGLKVTEAWEGTGKDRKFIGFVKEWKLADKNAALEKLMRHLGAYREDNGQKGDPLTTLLRDIGSRASAFPAVATPAADDEDDGGGE